MIRKNLLIMFLFTMILLILSGCGSGYEDQQKKMDIQTRMLVGQLKDEYWDNGNCGTLYFSNGSIRIFMADISEVKYYTDNAKIHIDVNK